MTKPYCASLVLAEHVYQDGNGRWHLLGTMNGFLSVEFPAEVKIGLYLVLSDGHGKFPFKFRIVAADQPTINGDEVCSISTELHLVDPLVDFEFGGNLGTQITKPGTYFAEVWIGDDMVMSRRLELIEVKQHGEP